MTGVRVGLVLVGAWAPAKARTRIVVTFATAIIVTTTFFVLIAWILAPSSVKHAAPPTDE
jgi:hypothetical protein